MVPSPEPTVFNGSSLPIRGWEASGAIMVLGGVIPLDSDAENLWAAITSEYLVYEIVEVVGEARLERVELAVSLVSQNPPLSRHHDALRHRKLQDTEQDPTSGSIEQELTFDVLILLQSVVTEHDINAYIVGAFDTDKEKLAYLMDLRKTGHPAFAEASSVFIIGATSVGEVDESTFNPPPLDNVIKTQGNDENPRRAGLAAGLAVVGLVGFCLSAYFFVKGRRQRQRTEQRPPSQHNLPGNSIDSEIEVGPRTEISSLGDPIPPDVRGFTGSSTTGSKSTSKGSGPPTLGYDFAQEFRKTAQSVASLGESQSDSNSVSLVIKDDNTLEAEYFRLDRFEVEAPSGRLDIVLETCNGRAPVVQAISDLSPLAGQVQEGDTLLTLDGVDVTDMMASDVSQLMAEKQTNPVRRFVFAMSPRVGYVDSVDE